MSAQAQLRQIGPVPQPVRMRVKSRHDDDDRGMIFVLPSDPFQSLTAPPGQMRIAPAEPRTEKRSEPVRIHTRQTLAREFLKPPVAPMRAPAEVVSPAAAAAKQISETVAAEVAVQGSRSSAREAWSAVVLMGLFITGGIVWTSNRIDRADAKITDLQSQLDGANMALASKDAQMKQLYTRAVDAESDAAKARAAAGGRVVRR